MSPSGFLRIRCLAVLLQQEQQQHILGSSAGSSFWRSVSYNTIKSGCATTMTVAAPVANMGSTAAATVDGNRAPPYTDPSDLDAHVERAWAHFRSLGSPMWHVAPMVDQSELPFRMLCRSYGAQAAYTPMFHARLFLEHQHYRDEQWSTCPQDRPLFVQFCANDPEVFVGSASIVQDQADYIDLNLGCPQRIAKRGYYGAFLMDNLQLVQQLVSAGASRLRTPVSVKIRLFPDLQKTIDYALMLQAAGASLLAVHGRTREQKDHASVRADWAAIAAVRKALRIPVLANGDVRCLAEAHALMAATGADGVMSAAPLLHNPRLFDPQRPIDAIAPGHLEGLEMCEAYLHMCEKYPAPMRMVRGHVHKLVSGWLMEFTDIRNRLHSIDRSDGLQQSIKQLQQLVAELRVLVQATGRDYPIPQLSERKQQAMEREAAKAAAIAEQEREAAALAEVAAAAAGPAAAAAVAADAMPAAVSADAMAGAAAAVSTDAMAATAAAVTADATAAVATAAASASAACSAERSCDMQEDAAAPAVQERMVAVVAAGQPQDAAAARAPKRQAVSSSCS